MNTKYLYCKYSNLKSFILTGKSLRFTDINTLKNRENELIRDDESERSFVFTPKTIKRFSDGHITLSGNQIEFIEITVRTRRCHVLCLSNKKNDPALFERFKADACLELNVGTLMHEIDLFFKKKVKVVGRNVDYYDVDSGMGENPTDMIFQKNAAFRIEDEYRIALFYPFDERTVLTRGDRSEIMMFEYHEFIGIGMKDRSVLEEILCSVFRYEPAADGPVECNETQKQKLVRFSADS